MAQAIPIVIMAAAAGYSAYSSHQAGKAQEKAADKAADRAKLSAAREADDAEKLHRRIIASQEARYGAAGLTMEGSPLLVQHEAIKESKDQLERIREGGEYASGIYKSSGDEFSAAGDAGAIKALLSGAGSTYKAGADYNWW